MIEIARAVGSSPVSPGVFHERWCDLASHPEWSAGMEYLRLSEPFAVGARGELKSHGGEPAAFIVTEVEPGAVYADTTLLDGATLTVRHEARPGSPSGSVLTVTAFLDGPEAAEWALRMGDSVQHDLAADLANLRALLETRGAATN